MGKVTITIEIANNEDVILSKVKFISEVNVRQVSVDDTLISTSATTLCLPRKYIEQLGLPFSRKVVVSTATGEYLMKMYNNALLTIQGRSAVVEVIELHDEARTLLGVIPMEILGLEVDVVKHELRLLPDHSKDTYLLAY